VTAARRRDGHPVPGMLAISARKMLCIVEGAREPTGRLIAIKLN